MLLTLYGLIIRLQPECSCCTCEKDLSAPAVWLDYWQLSTKIHLKAPWQDCLPATVLTRQKLSALMICAILCAETFTKKRCRRIRTHRHLGRWQCDLWLARIGGKLAPFTVNLIANVSYIEVPCKKGPGSASTASHLRPKCLKCTLYTARKTTPSNNGNSAQ